MDIDNRAQKIFATIARPDVQATKADHSRRHAHAMSRKPVPSPSAPSNSTTGGCPSNPPLANGPQAIWRDPPTNHPGERNGEIMSPPGLGSSRPTIGGSGGHDKGNGVIFSAVQQETRLLTATGKTGGGRPAAVSLRRTASQYPGRYPTHSFAGLNERTPWPERALAHNAGAKKNEDTQGEYTAVGAQPAPYQAPGGTAGTEKWAVQARELGHEASRKQSSPEGRGAATEEKYPDIELQEVQLTWFQAPGRAGGRGDDTQANKHPQADQPPGTAARAVRSAVVPSSESSLSASTKLTETGAARCEQDTKSGSQIIHRKPQPSTATSVALAQNPLAVNEQQAGRQAAALSVQNEKDRRQKKTARMKAIWLRILDFICCHGD